MKKVGELIIDHKVADDTQTKTIWGDIFSGDGDDNDVDMWGIIYCNLKPYTFGKIEEAIEQFNTRYGDADALNEDIGDDMEPFEFGIRIKNKLKRYDKYPNKQKIYVCRPEDKMEKVLRVIDGYYWNSKPRNYSGRRVDPDNPDANVAMHKTLTIDIDIYDFHTEVHNREIAKKF